MYKYLPPILKKNIDFNSLMLTVNCPTKWSQHILIPILKKDKNTNVSDNSSLRPIAISNFGRKIFEKLVNNRLRVPAK